MHYGLLSTVVTVISKCKLYTEQSTKSWTSVLTRLLVSALDVDEITCTCNVVNAVSRFMAPVRGSLLGKLYGYTQYPSQSICNANH